MKDKLAKIGLFMLSIGLNAFQNQLPQIVSKSWLKDAITLIVDQFKTLVEVLSDDNPENEEQLEEKLKENAPKLVSDSLAIFKKYAIDPAKDTWAKSFIENQFAPLEEFTMIYLDDNPDNKGQLQEFAKKHTDPVIDQGLDGMIILAQKLPEKYKPYVDLMLIPVIEKMKAEDFTEDIFKTDPA